MGQPTTVTLVFGAVRDTQATVRFTTDAVLTLTSALAPLKLFPLGESQLVVQAVPHTGGLFYINIFTTQDGITSVTSVPVQT